MANKQLINALLKNKWSNACVAYGTKTDPDPRDGMFRYICMGNNKHKDGYANSMAYEKMLRLQKVLNTPCRVEKNDTEYVVGGSMYIKTEHFDQFLQELRQMNN
jgi:hypothetical protein